MKKIIVLIIFLSGSILTISAQSGLRIHSGITVAASGEESITPTGTAHYGYHLGADFRLFADTEMFFSGGAEYHRLSLLSQESLSFFNSPSSLNILKGKWGIGIYLFKIGKQLKVRSKIMGVLNYISGYDTAVLNENLPSYKLNDSHLGALVGLGIDISHITIDLEYEKGFINAYQNISSSKIDYLNLSVGVFF